MLNSLCVPRPCSTLCVFLGYSPDHKGYWCLDLATHRVIISRHVVFDETTFPFSLRRPMPPSQELDFLTNDDPLPVLPFPAGTPGPNGPSMAGHGHPAPHSPPAGFPAPQPRIAPVPSSHSHGMSTATPASPPDHQAPRTPPSQSPPSVPTASPAPAASPPAPSASTSVAPTPPVAHLAPRFIKPPVVHVYSRRPHTQLLA